jgi:hypothetical protein
MGQKRNFSSKFVEELSLMPDNLIIVDLFGGSGILSHLSKVTKPESTVIYNDFDNFQLRLKSVHITNDIIAFSRQLLQQVPREAKVPLDLKKQILDEIERQQLAHGYIDYITLSAQFLFSGSYALSFGELAKGSWYNTVRKSEIVVDGYLAGVEAVTLDYRGLYAKYKDVQNVVFIIDPPYLQTQSITYSKYWQLKDHLDALTVLFCDRFFYFTSSKSHIIELMDWLDNHGFMLSPFKHCKRLSHQQFVNASSTYEDIMFVKR